MAKPIERTIVQPIMPREIDLKEPMWYAVTEANIDEFLIDIKEDGSFSLNQSFFNYAVGLKMIKNKKWIIRI